MTPLAQAACKQLLLPLAKRSIHDRGNILGNLDDIHCFECSEILELAGRLSYKELSSPGMLGGLEALFLPAPKTWIEWQPKSTIRVAILLIEKERGLCSATYVSGGKLLTSVPLGNVMLGNIARFADGAGMQQIKNRNPDLYASLIQQALVGISFLPLINTPRMIGREVHFPHSGLQRKLLKKQRLIGTFPLHAWHELKLSINIPAGEGDGEEEAHYTGQRALHFCRAHLRVRGGRVELVRAHWRGDPALGIKQTRYKMTTKPSRRR